MTLFWNPDAFPESARSKGKNSGLKKQKNKTRTKNTLGDTGLVRVTGFFRIVRDSLCKITVSAWDVRDETMGSKKKKKKEKKKKRDHGKQPQGAFFSDDPDHDQWSKITRIIVLRKTADESFVLVRLSGSFDARWFNWSWINDPGPDHPKNVKRVVMRSSEF